MHLPHRLKTLTSTTTTSQHVTPTNNKTVPAQGARRLRGPPRARARAPRRRRRAARAARAQIALISRARPPRGGGGAGESAVRVRRGGGRLGRARGARGVPPGRDDADAHQHARAGEHGLTWRRALVALMVAFAVLSCGGVDGFGGRLRPAGCPHCNANIKAAAKHASTPHNRQPPLNRPFKLPKTTALPRPRPIRPDAAADRPRGAAAAAAGRAAAARPRRQGAVRCAVVLCLLPLLCLPLLCRIVALFC